jgi:hypothetical protein
MHSISREALMYRHCEKQGDEAISKRLILIMRLPRNARNDKYISNNQRFPGVTVPDMPWQATFPVSAITDKPRYETPVPAGILVRVNHTPGRIFA